MTSPPNFVQFVLNVFYKLFNRRLVGEVSFSFRRLARSVVASLDRIGAVIRPSAGEMPERRQPDSLPVSGHNSLASALAQPRQELRPPVCPTSREHQPI